VHNQILLITPFAWKSLPLFLSFFLLTWYPSFASWCDSHPIKSLVGCILTSPPFAPHSLFPFPQQFPISNTCPSTRTLRNWLHIVRYNYFKKWNEDELLGLKPTRNKQLFYSSSTKNGFRAVYTENGPRIWTSRRIWGLNHGTRRVLFIKKRDIENLMHKCPFKWNSLPPVNSAVYS
jgi:hypothetical protein